MFAAVVYKYHNDTDPKSHKPEGDWSCFLGHTKEEAIEAAVLATARWEVQPKQQSAKYDMNGIEISPSKSKYYGPYKILVGELTEEAKRTKYEVVTAPTDFFEF